ncbi:endolytic transglycosylase MltG [Candidatus Kuenenbacteria bacterium]|nr:endolytic transglycosylase MltG [Candidatus Kuenenbacteria bacterium]
MKKYLIVVILIIIIFAFYFANQIYNFNDNQFGDKVFVIEKGQSVEQIAKNLQEQGIIKSSFWFKVYVFSTGNKAKFVDGEFSLRTDTNLKTIAHELLTQRETNEEVDITLLEGWTIEQMDEYLAVKLLIEQGDLIDYTKKFNDKSWFFLIDRPKKASLEGYLYPDTYRVYQQTTPEQIVKKMLDNLETKLTEELRAQIKAQDMSVFEIITLASIVEREMFGYENRRVVAEIFLKRLKIGMALQSDATVNYVTRKGIAAPSHDDIRVDNLYNTYMYPGLPPGPISNPSIESIRAVLNPTKTDYWYFLNTPEGDIIFSKDHDEHVANKFKYLK